MNRLLIDTNIYSHALRGAPEIIEVLRNTSHIGITSISIGELFSGFRGGSKEQVNRKELYTFLDSPRVELYNIDEETAEHYSIILNQLKQQGTPIPTNDIWIAAVAFQQGLPLFTTDHHFKHIANLLLR